MTVPLLFVRSPSFIFFLRQMYLICSSKFYLSTFFPLQDGNTFCTTLNPRLFTMDLSIIEHKIFFQEVRLYINVEFIFDFRRFRLISSGFVRFLTVPSHVGPFRLIWDGFVSCRTVFSDFSRFRLISDGSVSCRTVSSDFRLSHLVSDGFSCHMFLHSSVQL